jgi:hypothetical protein
MDRPEFDPDLAYYRVKARRSGGSWSGGSWSGGWSGGSWSGGSWKDIDLPALSAQAAIVAAKSRGFDEVVVVTDDLDRFLAPLVRVGESSIPTLCKVRFLIETLRLPRFLLWFTLIAFGFILLWNHLLAAVGCIFMAILIGIWFTRDPAPAINLQSAFKAHQRAEWSKVAENAGAFVSKMNSWGWEGFSAASILRVFALARMGEFNEAQRLIDDLEEVPDCRKLSAMWLRSALLELQDRHAESAVEQVPHARGGSRLCRGVGSGGVLRGL